MDASEALSMSEHIQNRFAVQDRISVTELARGTEWRRRLADCGVLEVVDRGATAGWLLSSDGMQALLDTISYFEAEAERTQVAYIVESRARYEDWRSGADLSAAVADIATSEIERLAGAFE